MNEGVTSASWHCESFLYFLSLGIYKNQTPTPDKKNLCAAHQDTWENHSSVHPKVSGLDHRGGCGARGVPAELTAVEAAVAEKVVGGLTVGQQDFLAEKVEGESSEWRVFSTGTCWSWRDQVLSLRREVWPGRLKRRGTRQRELKRIVSCHLP